MFVTLISGPEYAQLRLPDGENLAKVSSLSLPWAIKMTAMASAIHVDGAAGKEDKPRHSLFTLVLSSRQLEGDRAVERRDGFRNLVAGFIVSENGWTWWRGTCSQSSDEGLQQSAHEGVGIVLGHHVEEQQQNNKGVDDEAHNDRNGVHPQLTAHLCQFCHF